MSITRTLPETVDEGLLFADFLESTPPGKEAKVRDLLRMTSSGRLLHLPPLRLPCSSDGCGGPLNFEAETDPPVFTSTTTLHKIFLMFRCRNCQKTLKSYALILIADPEGLQGRAYKFGEVPRFGPPTSARLLSLIGPDRDAFLNGRRAEMHSLGIGAFAYYRRVVERQKDRILSEILRVAEKNEAGQSVRDTLEAAKGERQFSRAVEMVKDGIPEAVKIKGHNPLTLLHRALSEGLHNESDETCLELAGTIRVVLQELAEKVAYVLKNEAELNAALGRLMRGTAPPPSEDGL